MKTIIAGSREITQYGIVFQAAEDFYLAGHEITEVVSGGARGIDRLGERYAKEEKIPLKVFPADWNTHGKAAGHIRNLQMAQYADALIAIWDGKSRGTKNMIDNATNNGLIIFVKRLS